MYALRTYFFIYRVNKKKLNRFEIALNFAKQLLVSSFLYKWLLWELIMWNNEKNFSNSNFVNQGGVFSNKLKMTCAQNVKALIVF
jgi:hypothetical protein